MSPQEKKDWLISQIAIHKEKYDKDLLNRFYVWASKEQKDGSMKYETFKTFSIGRRLATFKKLQPKYNPTAQQIWEQAFHPKTQGS